MQAKILIANRVHTHRLCNSANTCHALENRMGASWISAAWKRCSDDLNITTNCTHTARVNGDELLARKRTKQTQNCLTMKHLLEKVNRVFFPKATQNCCNAVAPNFPTKNDNGDDYADDDEKTRPSRTKPIHTQNIICIFKVELDYLLSLHVIFASVSASYRAMRLVIVVHVVWRRFVFNCVSFVSNHMAKKTFELSYHYGTNGNITYTITPGNTEWCKYENT